MRGEGTCPLNHEWCNRGLRSMPKEVENAMRVSDANILSRYMCEFWDEYEQNCSVNVISINLRKIEGGG